MKILLKNKIIALLLIILTVVFSTTSCAFNRSYDESEVKGAAEALIKASEKLNEIYYGKGIRYIDDVSYANGAYYKADSVYLSAAGIETIDDLKVKTREVFSAELSNIMISTTLSPFVDEESGVQRYTRYYQKYSALDNSPECIMVYKNASYLFTSTITYDYESVKVIESVGDLVYVTIDATVVSEDDKSQKRVIKIGLTEEESGWKIDTPTYVNYADLDYYYEMQDKEK